MGPSIAASPPPGKGEIRRAIATPPASPHDFMRIDFREFDFRKFDLCGEGLTG